MNNSKHSEEGNNIMASLIQITPNLHRFISGEKVIYFSYETAIAYYDYIQKETVVSKNIWTRTTEKHLNFIKATTSKHVELPHSEFILCLKDYS
jgi:hypothetical protein